MGGTGSFTCLGVFSMRVRCGMGDDTHLHDVSPTALAIVLEAIRTGELIKIGPDGVTLQCYKEAFTQLNVNSAVVRYGAKNVIRFDRKRQWQA